MQAASVSRYAALVNVGHHAPRGRCPRLRTPGEPGDGTSRAGLLYDEGLSDSRGFMKVYSLTVRNRFTATLLAIAVLGIGAAFLAVGIALLAGLAIAGGVLGSGVMIYHRLRGTRPSFPAAATWREMPLDPSLEVFPETRSNPDRALPAATDNG
jgi:hypothetical protein